MKAKGEGVALVGVGAATCVACCAGPILSFVAAIGLGTVAGLALFGVFGLIVAAVGAFIVVRRRRWPSACGANAAPVAVEMRPPSVAGDVRVSR